jgi:predicted kinase
MKIIMIAGLPGSGKTFFASRLAEKISAEHVSSDALRKKMFASRNYSQEEKKKVYQKMLDYMAEAIFKNKNIILDATFHKEALRELFFEKAKSFNTNIYIIEIVADFPLIRKRLIKKREDSEADIIVYENLKKEFEPIIESHLVLQSREDNIEFIISQTLDYIHE